MYKTGVFISTDLIGNKPASDESYFRKSEQFPAIFLIGVNKKLLIGR